MPSPPPAPPSAPTPSRPGICRERTGAQFAQLVPLPFSSAGKSGEEIGLGKDLDLDDDVSMPPEAQTATKADDGGAQKAPPMPSPPPAAPVVAAGSA